MRKRSMLAIAVAALAVTSGSLAYANTFEEEKPARTVAAEPAGTVTLPTGDRVTLGPEGGLRLTPRQDGKDVRLFRPKALDGSKDVIAIPTDRMDDIVSGKDDPRRYNISELLRAGRADAAKTPKSKLSDKDYGRYVPITKAAKTKATKQKVTVKTTNRSGKAPEVGAAAYSGIDNKLSGEIAIGASGTGTVKLPPGRYDIVTAAEDSANGEYVGGVLQVKVSTKPVTATANGKKSVKVSAKVDRASESLFQEVTNGADSSKSDGAELGAMLGDDGSGYLIPTKKITDHTVSMSYQNQRVSPQSAKADPYGYQLLFRKTKGIPADLTFKAPDAKLAAVTTKYDGFATTTPAQSCSAPTLADVDVNAYGCILDEAAWGTSRVDYVTANKNTAWHRNTVVGDSPADWYFISDKKMYTYKPGQQVTQSVGHAPVVFNPASDSVVSRNKDTLFMRLVPFDNADPQEEAMPWGYSGVAVVKRDGKEVGRTNLNSNTGEGDEIKLPKGDSGRYTLDIQAKSNVTAMPLGTKTNVTWEFASKPTTSDKKLPVSAVNFQPEGTSGGYAEAGKEQKFGLTYAPLPGHTDTKAKKLAFDVSYDDGKTWKKVAIDRDGDKATGTLKHPAGAKFASVRMSVTDDKGNKVTHSTLRAFALK